MKKNHFEPPDIWLPQSKSSYLVIIFALACIFFVVPYLVTRQSFCFSFDSNTGVIGDTIGGIVGPIIGLIGILITFQAFYIQYVANNFQRKAIYTQQLESKLFELLRIHRENLISLKSSGAEGSFSLKTSNLLLMQMIQICNTSNIGKVLSDIDVIRLSFSVLYSGLNKRNNDRIVNSLKSPHEHSEKTIRLCLTKIDNIQPSPDLEEGQESQLESYYRNLYQIYAFLDSQGGSLSVDERTVFDDIIFAQISRHEAILVLFFATTEEGAYWRKQPKFLKRLCERAKIKEFLDVEMSEIIDSLTKDHEQ